MPGSAATLNQSLEKAGRVADFLELGELMCLDALHRDGVLRRALPRREPDRGRRGRRATTSTSPTSRPGSTPAPAAPVLHKEDLDFDYVTPSQRSYK